MKKLLAIILCLPLCVFAQVPPPAPASSADVTAGTATYKFISPAALAAAGFVSYPTNGITAATATNIATYQVDNRTLPGANIGVGSVTTNKVDAAFYNLLTNTASGGSGLQSGNTTDATNINLTVTGTLNAADQTVTTLSATSAYLNLTNVGLTTDGDGKIVGTNGVTQSGLAAGSYTVATTNTLAINGTNAITVSPIENNDTNSVWISGSTSNNYNGAWWWNVAKDGYTNATVGAGTAFAKDLASGGSFVITNAAHHDLVTPDVAYIASDFVNPAGSFIFTDASTTDESMASVFGTNYTYTPLFHGNGAGVTGISDATNLVFEGRPYYQNRRYDVLYAAGATSTDTGINGYLYQSGANSCSNLFYGNDTATTFLYTNAAGWKLGYDGTTCTITNPSNVRFWHGGPNTLCPVAPVNASEWTKKIQCQSLYFPFGTKDGAAAAGPTVTVADYVYSATTNYPKVVVIDGDSRLDGWNRLSSFGDTTGWGVTYAAKSLAAHPFFKNAYVTNLSIYGSTSITVSNRYAGQVYPLRPQSGQVGYYIVWTGVNGDVPATVAATLAPLYKQAKKDGWIVVAVTSPPTPFNESSSGYTYGEDQFRLSAEIRRMNSAAKGENGCWDILVDLESVLPNLLDVDLCSDWLHTTKAGSTLRIGEYIAQRCQQGTMTDGHGMYIQPAETIGAFVKFGVTNIVHRISTNYQNILFKGGTLMAGSGFGVMTNQGAWPTIPQSPGACYIGVSNGFPYMLLSTNGGGGVSQVWTGTNKLGW